MTAVVLSAGKHYLRYVPALLAQLARFGRRAEGVTLVVPGDITDVDLADASAVASASGLSLDVVVVSDLADLYDRRVIVDASVSFLTYCKLLFAERLTHLDDVLYLDIDTVICHPLDDLLSWGLRHPLGAVPDVAAVRRTGDHWGTPGSPYFNAGVLRMSLERMRQERIWEQSLAILAANPRPRYQDQDVLNTLFSGRYDVLPLNFNVFDRLSEQCKDLAPWRDPAIVHFSGELKPWHRSAHSPFAREWRRYHAEALRMIDADADIDAVLADGPASPAPPKGVWGLAHRVIPQPAKGSIKSAAVRALDRTLCRLEGIRTDLDIGSTRDVFRRRGSRD